MTLTDNPHPRKPSRWVLFAPFALLLAAVVVWIFVWSSMRREVFRRMDDAAGKMDQTGYRVDWSRRSLSGFPFRLDLDIAEPSVMEVSGWGVSAPALKAEAFVFAPDHWVIVAPQGVTFTRRHGGTISVGAKVLRASLSESYNHPPRISVEGLALTFTPTPGAAPFALADAAELHIHTKAGPQDQGAAYLEIDKARTNGTGPLARIAGARPLSFIADVVYSHASGLNGQGWAGAVRAWAAAGGEITVRRLLLDAGEVGAHAHSGRVGIGADGRLTGRLDLDLSQPQRLLAALTRYPAVRSGASIALQPVPLPPTEGNRATATVDFQSGRTTLGPMAIGPSPRVY